MAYPLINGVTNLGSWLLRDATPIGIADQAGQSFCPTPDRYVLAESYYLNTVYTRWDAGNVAIKAMANLPRTLRPVVSLVKPAVDYWPDTMFGGEFTSDGLPTSNGKPNRIPYDADTPEEVRLAVQQGYAWGNWGTDILVYVLLGAMLGDVFVEVEADDAAGRVYPILHHPKLVTELEWDRRGNLTMYRLAIPQKQENGTSYVWGKRVTEESITTYYNDAPQGYDGMPATIPNPWGFVPAVWVQHRNVGGQHGQSVFDALYPVMDEFQGVIGAIDDYINLFVRPYVVMETPDPAGLKKKLDEQTKDGPTWQNPNPYPYREGIRIQPAPPGSVPHTVLSNLGLGEADPHVARLMANIEQNLPELSIEQKMADLGQVTGPGARAIVAPMQRRINLSFGNYARGVVKLGQMMCSIGGDAVRAGRWGLRSQLSEQQQRFAPFDLNSFHRGDLDFSLTTPTLLQPTMAELAAEAKLVEGLTTTWGLTHAGLGLEDIYGRNPDGTAKEPDGLAPGETAGISGDKAANREAQMAQFGNAFGGGAAAPTPPTPPARPVAAGGGS